MNINELLAEKNMSKYRLSKSSGVPYATLEDICSGKTDLKKCSAETVYRLTKVLDVSMEDLIEAYIEDRPAFELFKSNMCHLLKELGDIEFIAEVLKSDKITSYYQKEWFAECFYLLAMTDYVSRINDIPLCDKYDDIRKLKLKGRLYPSSYLTLNAATKKERRENISDEAIPEFLRFNIVEGDIRNVR